MGFLNYKLLWIFFTNRDFLGKFIAEWAPTLESDNPVGLYFYIIMGAIATILFLSVVIKRKIFVKNLIYFPFFPLILLGYTATRNVYLGTFGYFVLLGISMSEWGLQTNVFLSKTKKMIIGIIAILWVLFFTQTLREKSQFIQFERRYYPVQSTEFVKRYLKGRMYNDYTYGGYVLYQVYPKLQVLIDGRAEVYLCCEMRDYVSLAINKNLPDREYIEFLKNYFDSYHISFAILPVYKHNVIRRIARHLQYDLHWALVFWDDESQVFVKRDGLNDAVIAQMEAKAATPYSKDPFDKENIERALFEYERIDAISKSARTHNALGYIYLLQGEYVKAKERFLEAINQDPWFESPFMNLAELAVKDGDLDTAIANYQKAKTRAEDRGLIYIRLGQLLLERDGNQAKSEVRKLWEQGIAKTVDEDAKKELEKLLLSLL
jgi:tetratricopeptide (TPR) repeat protein